MRHLDSYASRMPPHCGRFHDLRTRFAQSNRLAWPKQGSIVENRLPARGLLHGRELQGRELVVSGKAYIAVFYAFHLQ